jgi:hypothetical protein
MSIECVNYKEYKSGALQGFALIYVDKWDLEIKGCKVFSKSGARWFSLPSKEFTNEAGETKFEPLIRFRNKETAKQFGIAALQAIDKWCAENNQHPESDQPEQITMPF